MQECYALVAKTNMNVLSIYMGRRDIILVMRLAWMSFVNLDPLFSVSIYYKLIKLDVNEIVLFLRPSLYLKVVLGYHSIH